VLHAANMFFLVAASSPVGNDLMNAATNHSVIAAHSGGTIADHELASP
jgi:hypothetical protein